MTSELLRITKIQNRLMISEICKDNNWNKDDILGEKMFKNKDIEEIYNKIEHETIHKKITNITLDFTEKKKGRGRPKKFKIMDDDGTRSVADELEEDFKRDLMIKIDGNCDICDYDDEDEDADIYVPIIINNNMYMHDNVNVYDLQKNMVGILNDEKNDIIQIMKIKKQNKNKQNKNKIQ